MTSNVYNKHPCPEFLREYFAYDDVRGGLLWTKIPKRARVISVGAPAGFLTSGRTPCIEVHLLGQRILVHRAVWVLFHGAITSDVIDHINGDRTDNRIENLRPASFAQNSANRRGPLRGGEPPLGVRQHRTSGRFEAAIQRLGTKHHLGTFNTFEEAHRAYLNAAVSLSGEFARVSS